MPRCSLSVVRPTRILGLWPMQLITVPNICPVAVAVAVVVVVARAFVDEVDFMEILCRTRRTAGRARGRDGG